LLTLEQVGADKLGPEMRELRGVNLTSAPWEIVDRSANSATFRRVLGERGLVVTKRYELAKVEAGAERDRDAPAYHLALTLTIENTGGEAAAGERKIAYRLDGGNGLPIEGWWYVIKTGREWSAAGIRDVVSRFFGARKPIQQGAPAIATSDITEFDSGSLAHMGVDAQYFAVALLPGKDDPAEEWVAAAAPRLVGPPPDRRTSDPKYANVSHRFISETASLESGDKLTHTYTIFAGPKRPQLLAKYQAAGNPAYSLNDFVYYGWFGGVARLMVGILHVFYSWVGNYGIAIVMLTVLVRGCLFPISRGQAKSMAKLQELRPEMEKIKEKYKGDQQKQAQAMQQLYRKHNVNPLAGCLPMLIQLPVFVGLYRGLAVDVELRQAPLFGDSIRWCSNLAAPDMLYDWSWFMPRFINSGEGFFGLGPYLNILPLVTVGLFLWQQHMFMPPAADEQTAMQQKIMKWMMVFMGLFFYKSPSGLCLYFIASSLWGIGERKLVPPPTSSLGSAAPAAPDGAAAKRSSTAPVETKRAGKNGQVGRGQRGKTKRQR
jgi:YidC/Oxa1 family membrane protein insertase